MFPFVRRAQPARVTVEEHENNGGQAMRIWVVWCVLLVALALMGAYAL